MSMGGARLSSGLTERQSKFVEFYLQSNDATDAAAKAGYSKKSARQQGTILLNHDKVKSILDKRRNDLARVTDISREYVLNGLKDIFDNSDSDKTRIAAAVEINKMCGFNEPDKHLHEHSGQISTVLLLPSNGRK